MAGINADEHFSNTGARYGEYLSLEFEHDIGRANLAHDHATFDAVAFTLMHVVDHDKTLRRIDCIHVHADLDRG
jgi:hypothetical protein